MGKFRRQNFCRKAGELNFKGFIFVHMSTKRNFYPTNCGLVLKNNCECAFTLMLTNPRW